MKQNYDFVWVLYCFNIVIASHSCIEKLPQIFTWATVIIILTRFRPPSWSHVKLFYRIVSYRIVAYAYIAKIAMCVYCVAFLLSLSSWDDITEAHKCPVENDTSRISCLWNCILRNKTNLSTDNSVIRTL